MAESLVQVTEGSGKKLHTNNYTVGANTVEDEFVVPGPYPYPTYLAGIVTATPAASDHILCLNAGASLKVRVHRISIRQVANATAAHISQMSIVRTTTAAPTGGTAVTPAAMDTSDTAGATGRSIPTVKGTETTVIFPGIVLLARQAFATTGAQADNFWEWRSGLSGGHGKPIIIPAGATNGLVIKMGGSVSGTTTWSVEMEFTETAF